VTVQENIQEAKELFFQNRPIEHRTVRPEILESWKRSRAFGVNEKKADKRVLSKDQLGRRIDKSRDLYQIAVPVMESLYTFTTGSGFLTVISDEKGYVLKAIGDKGIMELAKKNMLVEGCNRSERKLGTNAIGTPLETGKPIQVFGKEHYYSPHSDWVCSGAPIFNPDAKTIGVFCIIGPNEKVSFHTLGMAAASAEAITRQLKMKAAQDVIEQTQKNLRSIIEHIPSSLFLLDRNFIVKQVNSKAEKLFMLPAEEIAGRSLSDLFGEDIFTPEAFLEGVSDRKITVQLADRQMNLSASVTRTEGAEYLVTVEPAELLHKKVNKVIGSNAHFVFGDIVGASSTLANTITLAKIAAENNSSVLLIGESGTGKELFAQAIHNASARADGPFIAINCGALPKSLIESELFGYEGGSFTGAKREGHAGKFELANGGTIFLDEIGDMPFDVQVSLLRVLQSREITRIGSNKSLRMDVRVIAATNQDLQKSINTNAFRSDLYYRLNVFSIKIPPLRDRPGDIRLLADYFLQKYSGFAQRKTYGITADAYRCLEAYAWPGNVRELENVIERSTYIASGWIEADCLPDHIRDTVRHTGPAGRSDKKPWQVPEDKAYSIPKAEQAKIRQALAAVGGNVTKAAEYLEISRRTLYRKMEKYGLK